VPTTRHATWYFDTVEYDYLKYMKKHNINDQKTCQKLPK